MTKDQNLADLEISDLARMCAEEIKQERKFHGDLLLEGTISIYLNTAIVWRRAKDKKEGIVRNG